MNFRTVVIASILLVCLGSILGLSSAADSADAAPVAVVSNDSLDLDDAEVRENPVIEGTPEDIDIKVPSYIKESANVIAMNGADWSKTRAALDNRRKKPFTVVQIGDSHLQADIASGAVREFLQYDYGNAGRGLVIPYRIAGTNGPWDYSITSNHSWRSSKILRRPWSVPMGFTGISIEPASGSSDLFIATRDDDNYNPFNTLVIYHSGELNVTSVENREGNDVRFRSAKVPGGTKLSFSSEENGVRLNFDSKGLIVNGVNLSGNRPGVFYHTIGNNGATVGSYESIAGIGAGISHLFPDLIIISLGTNDAFGRFDANTFTKSLDNLVRNIRSANPNASILLTTPMECQKSVYSGGGTMKKRVKVKGKNGRSRWVTKNVSSGKRSRGYGVNSNIALVRNSIISYAKSHNIALYDWYEVSGGRNVSAKWISDGLYGADRVHHTAKGYRLNGFLLYQALHNALNSNNK